MNLLLMRFTHDNIANYERELETETNSNYTK